MHSLILGQAPTWSALNWQPPAGWWPEPAQELPPGANAQAGAACALPPLPEAAHLARAFAGGTLTGWGLPELVEGMELIASELATNALRHGMALAGPRRPFIRMSLLRRGARVTCAMADPGAAVPVLRDPAPFEPGGLGLHIVESMSRRWGWCPLSPYGKAVWAVLEA
ncbi:ATP-binding protein [Streptosporangiaceae bacterium NEAU-GS5]|nr:ATP-binding protein [Streptosporangiaceae bacterium NEAU-GS5]